MADPDNAGPYDVSPSGAISPGERVEIRFGQVSAGPANKDHYLRKIFGAAGGTDFVFIVNNSAELIRVDSKSGSTFVPPATSQNLTNGPYRSVAVINEGGADVNTGSTNKIAVETGNGPRGQEGGSFSVQDAVEDIVPGVTF